MKPGNAKSMMVMVLGLSIVGMMHSATQAQSRGSRPNVAAVADEQRRTGLTTFYYGHKSNAVGKLNAEQKRGKYARMYYDNARREWAVEVGNDLTNGGNNRTTVTTSGAQTVADEQRRTGITTFYYAHKSNAVGKLNAEQKRGKYARMYYNEARREWAVDVSNGLSNTTRPTVAPMPNETTVSTPQTGTYIYHYDYKSNAEGKLRAEKSRGKNARMFYDSGRRKWAVEVGNDLPVGNSTVGNRSVTTTTSADGGNLPNGASIIYFPTKASAEGIYKASLRQGDWAKMWYDAKRKEWAVAVKPR